MDWKNVITVNHEVCHGKACFKGTRVLVSVVLDNLAAGMTIAEITRSYPTVSADMVHAALAYAADLAREESVPLRAA
jgi:uncharacterized protein (DUF433 family)